MATIEVADVFRQFGPSYLDAHDDRMLPSHRRAIWDITACRTQAMGGHVYQCNDCGEHFHVYHGCRNRACPACHTHQIEQWFEARTAELLPCPYYHVTVTVPAQLRDMMRANQTDGYGLLMKAAAESVKALCRDKRYMGATPAILAVLHTWTAQMDYHPHVHMLVSGGGIEDDGITWREAKHPFLVPVRALSKLMRGKFHALLKKRHPGLEVQVPEQAWRTGWVAWCRHWGRGKTAVLQYLGRYVHRIAITNQRIVAMDKRTVAFRYKNRKSNSWHICTIPGHEFMRCFLQHVLPKGLHKVRYYGLWHCAKRAWQQKARLALGGAHSADTQEDPSNMQASLLLDQQGGEHGDADMASTGPTCPHCGSCATHYLGVLSRSNGVSVSARASPSSSS